MRPAGLFILSDHLKRLLAHGDPLEELSRLINFEGFLPMLLAVTLNCSIAASAGSSKAVFGSR